MPELLLLGQIGDPSTALPGGAGADLYVLSPDTYGQQIASTGGEDSPALIETDDYAPAGPGGKVLLRRVLQVVEWAQGAAVVQIRPIIDLQTVLPGQAFTLPQPASVQRKVLVVPVARVCRFVRLQIEVLSRAGRLEFQGSHVQVRVLKGSAAIGVTDS